jgi:hypothetical protein
MEVNNTEILSEVRPASCHASAKTPSHLFDGRLDTSNCSAGHKHKHKHKPVPIMPEKRLPALLPQGGEPLLRLTNFAAHALLASCVAPL